MKFLFSLVFIACLSLNYAKAQCESISVVRSDCYQFTVSISGPSAYHFRINGASSNIYHFGSNQVSGTSSTPNSGTYTLHEQYGFACFFASGTHSGENDNQTLEIGYYDPEADPDLQTGATITWCESFPLSNYIDDDYEACTINHSYTISDCNHVEFEFEYPEGIDFACHPNAAFDHYMISQIFEPGLITGEIEYPDGYWWGGINENNPSDFGYLENFYDDEVVINPWAYGATADSYLVSYLLLDGEDYPIGAWNTIEIFPCPGCNNPLATNYDFNAGIDDGSCEFDGPIPGDANGDFIINMNDFLMISSNFGCTSGCTLGDANNDGLVNIEDLNILIVNFEGN